MITLTEEVDLKGYTLILPSVAVGNVGQLAVDLFISSLGAARIGYVWDSAFIPIIGPDPYDENSTDLCTAVDLFCDKTKRVILLQIRSPLTKKPLLFFEGLEKFIAEKQLAKVVILTSSYSHEKRDEQIRSVPLRYVASPQILSENSSKFDAMCWTHLESKTVEDGSTVLDIPGGGFAKNLYDLLATVNIPSAVLLRFCSEGDNIPDAVELATYLNQWLDLLPKDNSTGNLIIRQPPSWKFLFGNSPPLEMF